MTPRPVVLVIGGLDPSGGAGLLADAEAIAASGGRAVAVATALTFQSTTRATGLAAVPLEQLRRQLEPLVADEPIAAVKLGMLATAAGARLLAELHDGPLGRVPWVIDPVLAASAGLPLLDDPSGYAPLLPRASLLTPNAAEACRLAGLPEATTPEALLAAGAALRASGARAVLLKGGHVDGEATDRLLTADGLQSFPGTRLPGTRRGTGCRLASAVATGLARGLSLTAAIEAARALVRGYLVTGQCR